MTWAPLSGVSAFNEFGGVVGISGAILSYPALKDNKASSIVTFSRASAATVRDNLGNDVDVKSGELRFSNTRHVANMATGVVTETITVDTAKSYFVCIKGDNAAKAVCSGAFSATITADGTNRITFPNGTPVAATATSLTVTVTGTLTQLQVEAAN